MDDAKRCVIRTVCRSNLQNIAFYYSVCYNASMTESKNTATAYMADLSRRIRRYRIEYPMTQKELAEKAGVALRSVQYFEQGKDIRAENLIRILIALKLADNLAVLVPDMDNRPSALLKQAQGKTRQRASRKNPSARPGGFKWGDES